MVAVSALARRPSAAAIIPFSGAFVGELEPPLPLCYVPVIGLSECRLVRWSITALADAAWPAVSSQSAFYEAFTGAADTQRSHPAK